MERVHPVALDAVGKKTLLMGNEAIARGAIESGVQVATAYPGTPSSEIVMTLGQVGSKFGMHVEWSTNEIVALEVASGAALCGLRSLTAMKHVGLNVASDMLNVINLRGVSGLVLVSADDPGIHSSQNEQDSRWMARLACVPCIEPSNPQEAKDYTKYAFEVSEKFELPVILRSSTRVSHMRGDVTLGEISKEKREGKFDLSGRTRRGFGPHATLHGKVEEVREEFEKFEGNRLKLNGKEDIGIIASGAGFNYVIEALEKLNISDDTAYLKIATSYPLPNKLIKKLLSAISTLLIVEELEPWLELHIKAIAKDLNPNIVIYGKESKHIPREGELNTRIVTNCVADIIGVDKPYEIRPVIGGVREGLFRRMLALCPGCPHSATAYALKEAVRKVTGSYSGAIICGDIGCYSLLRGPPLSLTSMSFCMGASISVPQGVAAAKVKEIPVGIIGDSTFLHAGIPGLINAVYNKHDIKIVVCDNQTTAMTGFQPHPGMGVTATGEETKIVWIEDLVKACGVEFVKVVDSDNINEARDAMIEMLKFEGPAVVISRRLCTTEHLRQLRREGKRPATYRVDQEACTGCKLCLERFGCLALFWNEATESVGITSSLCSGCGVCGQICPLEAISQV